MWNRLAGVAGGVAGLVALPVDDSLRSELEAVREVLNSTQDDLRASRLELNKALNNLEEKEEEILNLTREDNSNILNVGTHSPTCDTQFYENQVGRLTDICTVLSKKEKSSAEECERLRTDLETANISIQSLEENFSSKAIPLERDNLQEVIDRLESERTLLLDKISSLSSEKDVLREEVDMLKECDEEKASLLASIKSLQSELQHKSSQLSAVRDDSEELLRDNDRLSEQVHAMLSEKQSKIQNNLFEVKEDESREEELDRLAVENNMLINKISELMRARDESREEIEALTEKMSQSKQSLLTELRDKEKEVEDAMMIVSVLQEQVRCHPGEDFQQLNDLLDDIKQRNSLAPKVIFLQTELTEARANLLDQKKCESELRTRLAETSNDLEDCRDQVKVLIGELATLACPSVPELSSPEDEIALLKESLALSEHTLALWQARCKETLSTWRGLLGQDRDLTTLDDIEGEQNNLQDLINTAEMMTKRSSLPYPGGYSPPETVELEHLKAENIRIQDCLTAREDLISGLREDIMIRQEKESDYREKVAELYDQIEHSQTATGQVKEVIDFSDSFVLSLEEQLSFAERIVKVKDEEICGLKKALKDINNRPITPTSPAPRYSETSIGDQMIRDLEQRITDAEEMISNLSNKNSSLLTSLSEHENNLVSVQKDNKCKDLDISKIQLEYEAELISMSTNFNDQKAVSSEEIGFLNSQVHELETQIRDLERDNSSLNENLNRIESENNVLKQQIDPSDNPNSEILAYQSSFNLKKQQLDSALQEIEALNESIAINNDQFLSLESSLSEQRDINVNLQNIINDLKEKCDVLEEKDNDYYTEIKRLNLSLDQFREALCSKDEHISELKKSLREAHEDYHQILRDGKSASGCSDSVHEKSDLLYVLKEMQSSMRELKISKDSLRSEVEDDLSHFTREWDKCVEEVKLYTDMLKAQSPASTPDTEALSNVAQNVKNLRDEYWLVKSNIESILEENVPSMMSELKTQLDKIVEINAEKEIEINTLKGQVNKYKINGKKCIDKLRKSIKDKDNLISKLSSDSGDSNANILQEELLSRDKCIQALEKNVAKLREDLARLEERGETPDNNASLNSTMNSSVISDANLSIRDENQKSDRTVSDELLNLHDKLGLAECGMQDFISRTHDIFHIEIISNEFGVDQFKRSADMLFLRFEESCAREKDLVSQLEDETSSNMSSSEKIVVLIEELTQKEEEIAQKDEEISQKTEEIAHIQEEIVEKDKDLSQKNEEISQKVEEIAQKDGEIDKREEEVQGILFEIHQLKEASNKKDIDAEDKRLDIIHLEDRVRDLEYLEEDHVPYEEVVVKIAEIEDLTENLEHMKFENDMNKDNIAKLAAELVQVKEELMKSEENHIQSQEELTQSKKEVDTLTIEVTDLLAVINEKSEELQVVIRKLNDIESNISVAELEEQICEKEKIIHETRMKKEEEISVLNDEIGKLRAINGSVEESLRNIKQELVCAEDIGFGLKNMNSVLHREVDGLTEENESILSKIEAVSLERDLLHGQIDSLISENEQIRTTSGQTDYEESGWNDEEDVVTPRNCEECNVKSVTISEQKDRLEDLECCIDTWTSQVAAVAEENETLQKSLSEKTNELETKLQEFTTIKQNFDTKSSEAMRYLAVIKKFKIVKLASDQKLIDNQHTIKQLMEENKKLSSKPSEITEMISEVPVICESFSASLYTQNNPGTHNSNEDKLDLAISVKSGDTIQALEAASPDLNITPPDTSQQEEHITKLRSEVSELQSVNTSFCSQITEADSLISSLSSQLDSAKELLSETWRECEVKLYQLQKEQERREVEASQESSDKLRAEQQLKAEIELQYQTELQEKSDQITELQAQQASYAKSITEMQDEWKEKEKNMISNLTEAEAVRFLSKNTLSHISEQDQDAMSEISEVSHYSRDTSYMSQSSRSVYHAQAMPDDVESLQAELLKKNKLAFLIKTKSKKLESKVREAKKECDKSKAHERVKEKVLAVETELSNITAQLRNLSSGKKTESTPKIDPRYVEEMEHRITVLTAVEQKYENLMEELQTQIHARSIAESHSDGFQIVIDELREKIEQLVDELRGKDSLLCDHMDASAEEDRRLTALREQYESQNIELQHLRDMNQKMKEALIHMTDESTKIEQTYKSTMHELENDTDELKCENATLNSELTTLGNELTTCWAKIEDLEAQNDNYMRLLEEIHLELQQRGASTADVDELQSNLVRVHEEKNFIISERDDMLARNEELIDRLNYYEGQTHVLSSQLQEIKGLYDESVAAQEVLTEDKETLKNILIEIKSKELMNESNIDCQSTKLLSLEASNESLRKSNAELTTENEELQSLVSSAEELQSEMKSTYEEELKSVYEENNILSDSVNDLQDSVDETKNKLNISNSDRSELTQKLDSVHNHLNDVLSEHEGCTFTIESKIKQCNALQDRVSEYSGTIESLREELNLVMETNSADLEQNDICIQSLQEEVFRLKNELSSRMSTEAAIDTLNSELESLNRTLDERSAEVINLQETKNSLDEQVVELKEIAEGLSKDLEQKLTQTCKLEEEIASLRSNDSTSAEKLFALEAEITTVKTSETTLQEQVFSYETTNTEIYTLLEDANYKLEQWYMYDQTQQEYLSQLTDQVTQYTKQLTQSEEIINSLNMELEALQKENIDHKEIISKLRASSIESEEKITELSTKMTLLKEHSEALQAENLQHQEAIDAMTSNFDEESNNLRAAVEHGNEEKLIIEAQLQAVIEEKEKTEKNVEDNLKVSNSRLKELQHELSKLVEEKSEVTLEVQQVRSESAEQIGELKSEIKSLKDEMEKSDISKEVEQEIQAALSEKKQLLDEKLKVIEELKCEKDTLSRQMRDLSDEVSELQEELAESNGKICLSEALLETSQEKHQALEDIIKTKEDHNKEMKIKHEKSNSNVEKLTKSNETLEAGISALHDRMVQSDEMVADMSTKLEQWYFYDQEQQSIIADLQSQSQGYVEEVEKVNNTLAQLTEGSELYKSENLILTEKVEELTSELSTSEEKRSENEQIFEELSNELATSEEKISQKEELLEKLSSELCTSEQNRLQNEQTLENLSSGLATSEQMRAQNEHILEELRMSKDHLEITITELEAQLTLTTQQKDHLTAERAKLNETLNSHEIELLKLNDLLEQSKSSTKQAVEEKEVITKKAKNVMKAYKDSKIHVEQLKRSLETKQKTVTSGEELALLQIEQLTNDNYDLCASKLEMEGENSKLLSEIENFDLEREIMNSLKQEISELKTKVIGKCDQVESLEECLSEATSQSEDLDLKISNLLAELENANIEIAQSAEQCLLIETINANYNEAMDSLQRAHDAEETLTERLEVASELLSKIESDCASKDDVISNLTSTIEEKNGIIDKLAEEAKSDYNEAITSLQKSQVVEESLSQRLEMVSIALHDANSKITAKETDIDQLSSRLEHSQSTQQQIEKDKRNLSSEIESLRFHVTSLNEQLAVSKSLENDITNFAQSSEGVSEALQEILEKARRCDELYHTLANSQNEVSELTEKLSFYLQDIEKLVTSTEKMSSIEEENLELQRKLETSERVRDETEQSIELCYEEIFKELATTKTALVSRNKELDDMVGEFHSTIDKLAEKEAEISNWKSAMSEKETAIRKVQESFDAQIKTFQSTALDDYAQVDFLQKELAHAGSEKRSLEDKLTELNNKISQLVDDNEQLTTSLQSKAEEIETLHEECERVFSKLDTAEREYESVEEQASEKDCFVAELQSQLQAAKTISSSLENDISNFSQSSESVSEALQGILQKAKRSDELSHTLANSQHELGELKEKLSFYTRDIEKLVTSTEKMSSIEEENLELQRNLETSERVRNETEQSIELLHHKFEQNFRELASTKTSLQSKNKELDDMVGQFHSTIDKLAEKESEISNWKSAMSEKETALCKVQENFDAQIKTFQSTATDDCAQVDFLQKELTHAGSEKRSLEDKLTELNNKISQLVDDNEQLTTSLQSKAEEIGTLQEECERVLSKLDTAEREYESVEEQASEKDCFIAELQSQLQAAKTSVQAAKTELEQTASSDEVVALRKIVLGKEKVMLEMNADIERLNIELREFDMTNNHLSSQFEAEKNELKNNVKKLQNSLETVRLELKNKSERVELLSGMTEHQSLILAELQSSKEVLAGEGEKLRTLISSLESELKDRVSEKEAVETELDSDKAAISNLINENENLRHFLQTTSTNNELAKAALDESAILKNSLLEVQQKLEDFKTTNTILEETSLRSEEKNLELLGDYDEKCKEIKELRADLATKGHAVLEKYEEKCTEIKSLREDLEYRDEMILEKEETLSQLQTDFNKLIENNSALEAKFVEFSQNSALKGSEFANKLTAQLQQAISDNMLLNANNTQLTANNNILSTNSKQLHESISVFQQRDSMLSDMCQKLQSHSELLNDKITSLEDEKSQLVVPSLPSPSETNITSLQEEIGHLKSSRTKLVSELEQTNSRLGNAAVKAESLEKSLYDITSRYNEQCSMVEKRTNDLTKLTRQYKHLKKRLVNELNARKTVLQDSISGRDRATVEIGERTKKLQEVQGQVAVYQKEREALVTIVESVRDCLKPLREDMESITQRCDAMEQHQTDSNDLDISRSQLKASAALLETLESKTRDVQCFLSRQLPLPSLPSSSLSRVDLSQYRDTDSVSEFSHADSILSDTISDFGDRSVRSEYSVYSEVPLTNHDNNHSYLPSKTRRSSNTSVSSDWIAKATPEINRTSTGVLNRLAYSLMGSDNRGRSPSENT